MTDSEILAEAVRRIDAHCHPRLVVLFGSRARGESRADSDFDLAVVLDRLDSKWQLEADLYGAVGGLPASFDILTFDAEQWREWSQVPVAFEYVIAHEGKELLRAA